MSEPVIVARDLRKRYGRVVALDGLSFEVPGLPRPRPAAWEVEACGSPQ